MNLPRIIVWVSAGAASAVAWKLAFTKYGDRCIGVYCDTSKSEERDNGRFLKSVSDWVGQPLTTIRSKKYRTVDEVFVKRQYMAGIKGAICTTEMKKIPRFDFQLPDDIHIFGFTSDKPELKRIEKFKANNFDLSLEFILRDNGISKQACFKTLEVAGIELPLRYRQGFLNNNCLCCVKASGIAYWIRERRINPDVFLRRCKQSRAIGARLTRWKRKRIFLDEIPPDSELPKHYFKKSAQENVSCGPECGSPGKK